MNHAARTSTERRVFALNRVTAGALALIVGLGSPLAVAQDLRIREDDPFGASPVELVPLPTREQLAEVKLTPLIIALVLRLDDPLFENREAAVEQLRQLRPTRLMLHKLLRQPTLSIEQRERLLVVARNEIETRPRGALGVSASFRRAPLGEPTGSVIQTLIPSLPAIEVLKRGDMLTHVDGIALTSERSLGRLVQLKRPGEPVRLMVHRTTTNVGREDTTETLEIVLELGSLDELERLNEQRSSRTTDPRPEEIADLQLRYSPKDLVVKINEPESKQPSAAAGVRMDDESPATDASPTPRGDR